MTNKIDFMIKMNGVEECYQKTKELISLLEQAKKLSCELNKMLGSLEITNE